MHITSMISNKSNKSSNDAGIFRMLAQGVTATGSVQGAPEEHASRDEAARPHATADDAAADDAVATVARKVLIVDDNADAAEMMAMLLSSCGHEVQTAGDAESSLRIANEFIPDVILLDIGLPGTDGYTIARILRRDPRFQKCMLIALTGYGSTRDRELSTEAGFDHHIVKPAQVDHLLQLLGTQE
jgi:two-component system OmpR family response regulator